jgi:Icc-related predicted phosphoesterase
MTENPKPVPLKSGTGAGNGDGKPQHAEAAAKEDKAERRQHVRVAAAGDLHARETSRDALRPLLARIAEAADVLVLCGDLTDHGLPAEAHVLARELSAAVNPDRLPTLAVLGNHDYEAGHADEVKKILQGAGVTVLDGDALEVKGVGFAGVKGFGGGFGRGTLSGFGESAVKHFVQEAVDETMKLEAALLRLRNSPVLHRIAVLHYSPIRATVEGEPPEIFPFLGCSRMEEPLNRYQVTAVVHGHAHRGSPEGRTTGGAPVYNVSAPLMRQAYPDRPAFRVLDVPVTRPSAAEGGDATRPAPPDAATGAAAPGPPVETAVGQP